MPNSGPALHSRSPSFQKPWAITSGMVSSGHLARASMLSVVVYTYLSLPTAVLEKKPIAATSHPKLPIMLLNCCSVIYTKAQMIEFTKSKFTIDEIEVDKDHIHILVDSEPTKSPLDFVRLAKMMTTYHAWRSNWTPFLRSIYWKERTLWSDGYFVATTGQASTETIRQYIESQG